MSFLFNNLNKEIFDLYLLVIGNQDDNHYHIVGNKIKYLNKNRLRNALLETMKIIHLTKPNIVFGSIGHVNLMLCLFKFIFPKIKFVAREASVFSSMDKFNNQRRLPIFFQRLFYRKIDAFIYQSQDVKKDFQKIFSIPTNKEFLINNPISEKPELVIKSSKIKNEKVKFIIVGSLVLNKGHKRVFKLLEKITTDFIIEVIGEGPLKNELICWLNSSKIKNKVIFRGLQKNLNSIYESGDFLIQGSYVEGFPNVVLEALSYGIPCIVFKAPGGHNEMIIENTNGILIKNEDDFIKVEKAIHFDWDRIKIQNDILKRFNKEKIINQYEEMFLKVISS